MQLYQNVILVGSNCKNAGKTTLICKIIEHFKYQIPIIALKIAMRENVNHHKQINLKMEEKNSSDEQRMNNSGAKKTFYLKTDKEQIRKNFLEIYNTYMNHAIICESLSLREFIIPGIFIAIERNSDTSKERFNTLSQYADLKIKSVQVPEFNVNKIAFEKNCWEIK